MSGAAHGPPLVRTRHTGSLLVCQSPGNNGSFSVCTESVQLVPGSQDCCLVCVGELRHLCHVHPTDWSEGITEDTGWTRPLLRNKIFEKGLWYWSSRMPTVLFISEL